MTVVGNTLTRTHLEILELLLRFSKTRGRCPILYPTALQVLKPLFKGCRGHLVEFVDADDKVFREDAGGRHHLNRVFVALVDYQLIMRVNTDELVLAMIQVVGTLAQIEVDNTDGIHLSHLVILATQVNMLGNRLGYAIEYTLEIIELASLLDLNDDNLILGISGLDVNAIELVVLILLITLTLQDLHDFYLFIEQHSHQALENIEVRLVAKHTLHCPIKSYIPLVCHHFFLSCFVFSRFHNTLTFD